MSITIRTATQDDIEACGAICFDAFAQIAERHGFNPDFPNAEIPTGLLSALNSHPGFYAVVAEAEGRIVGSNFVDERGPVGGIGPVTVALQEQDNGIGRQLMEDVIKRADENNRPLRLTQAAYHARSLSLYAKLGFQVRDALCVMRGELPDTMPPGRTVRPATSDDLEACSALCKKVHAHDRDGELADAIAQGSAMLVEHNGEISGYCTLLGYFGHAVAESNDDLKALIAAYDSINGPGFLLPARNDEVMQWCLENGMQLVHVATLMSRGDYQEPAGSFMPSVLY